MPAQIGIRNFISAVLLSPDEDLPGRVRSLQVLRMLELLAAESFDTDVGHIVADRLRTTLH